MADYYVRKSGSDSNNGTTPALAKLTIDGASGLLSIALAAGDRAFIGPGVYRERPVFDRSGSSGAGNQIDFIADHLGEHTTDAPGVVRISAFDANDQTADRAGAVILDASYFRLLGFVLHGASDSKADGNAVVFADPSAARVGVVLEDCLLDPAGGDSLVHFGLTSTMDLTLRRCLARSYGDWMAYGRGQGAHVLTLEDVLHEGWQGDDYFNVDDPGANWTINVNKCRFGPGRTGFFIAHNGGTTTVNLRNSLLRLGVDMGISDGGAVLVFTHQYNVWHGSAPTLDTGEVSRWDADLWPWSVLRVLRSHVELGADAGTATGAPTLDLLGLSVPQGSAVGFGPLENQDYPEQDTSVYRTSSPSMRSQSGRRLLHRFLWGVRAQQETFSVYARYNSSYTATPKPRLIIKAQRALGLASDTYAEAPGSQADTWHQLTVQVTPSVAGVVEVWLETYSTETGAQVRFDDFSGPIFST